MSGEIEDEEWGELIRNSDEFTAPIKLKKSKIVLGRSKDCEIKIDSRHVSGHHCYLQRNDLGIVLLYDTSTNGTFINKSKRIDKGQSHQLTSGDEIFLILKKDEPDSNVSFVYKELKCLSCEDSAGTLEYSLDCTKDNTTSDETLITDDYEPECKRVKSGMKEAADNRHVHLSQEAGPSESKEVKTEPKEDAATHPVDALDMMEESLTCSICQEIFHDCISLQPCMHCFCAGCYSPWMKKSEFCPQCRNKVIRISKNHIVNNLVEAFVNKHPDKKRQDSVLRELDMKNEIPHDTLYRQNYQVHFDYSSNSASSNSEDSEYEADYYPHNDNLYAPPYHVVKCRQCTGYQGPHKIQTNSDNNSVNNDVSGPSTSTAGVYHTPTFVCVATTVHAYCQCCADPMPDRRRERNQTPELPPQQCSRCYGLFCHMYWGCRKNGCNGCLNTLENMNFGDKCMTGIINGNNYESTILVNYLKSENLTWKDLLQTCLERLESNTYTCNPVATPTTVLCYRCALASFHQLAYLYRKDIPNASLPAEVTARADCYWGQNCRTQKTRPHHAANFNHICEQTKFA